MSDTYDVIVVGLGGHGSAAARQLARRGARVLGLERFGPVHAQGSSHGDTRIVRMAYFEHPDYVPLLRRSYQLWAELSRAVDEELFVRTGALMIGAPESAVVSGTLASVERWGLPHEVLDRPTMARRYPQFRLRAGELAVYEADAGYVSPEAAVRTHLRLAAADGAELRFHTTVTGWHTDSTGVVVETGDDEVRADKLVITAGAWTAQLAPRLGVPLRVGRRVMHYLAPLTSAADFAPDRFPVFIFSTGPGDEIYGFPVIGAAGNGVKVGFHHRGPNVDPDTVDRRVSPAEEEEMRQLLADRIPAAAGPHVQSKVCLYTLTPDEHFVIDHLPGGDNRVVVASACSGHGFKFTPVVGEILADLALTGSTPQPIEFLSAARFAVH
ncbi:MAG: N-methyl-L-tryptophan oxidase [Actinomycetota bacterium]|nr:N-methyl-L-tryptophan oxidase [Actinomycetota bacterium]